MNKFLRFAEKVLFANPVVYLAIIVLVTGFFALQIPHLKIYTDFADLLPQNHPYIKLHNQIRDTFGGANGIIISVEVDKGTIFTEDTLARIHRLTQAADSLPSVNHNLVTSLTHRTARKVWLSESGDVKSEPFYDPQAHYSAADLDALEKDVVSNSAVFGLLVSPDLKSALIKAQLNEGAINYAQVFNELQAARAREEVPGTHVYATGHPVLVGWVYSYLGQIMQIFLYTAAIMVLLVVIYFRRAYGIFIPLMAFATSAVWGLGVVSLLGYNLDPLTLVVPFLISARALSHGVQIVERYYQELAAGVRTGREAAQRTFESLFRPGALGVICDGIGIFLISVGSIPINTKLAYYGSLWALGLILSVLITVPLLLSILPRPKIVAHRANVLAAVVARYGGILSHRPVSGMVLICALVMLAVGGGLSSRVQIGESEPGSPLLYPDHDYNISSRAVNEEFPGSEEMYVIAHTLEKGGLKRPEVLAAIASLQTYMMTDPSLGGTKGLPDLIMRVNRLLHNNDPRFMRIPDTDTYAGGLMFAYMASNPIPGALKEFANPDETDANIVLYYKDHKGGTIRRATTMLKQWIGDPVHHVDGLEFRMAGGIVGVTAAGDEAAYDTNIIVIPLVFCLILIFVMIFYSSPHAGFIILGAMIFATTLSYGYMGVAGIGINVNTVPIIAIGIGVGIDYSIYMMDRVREEFRRLNSIPAAIKVAVGTTGLAVCFTAMTLMCGVVMWVFFSDMRFQADAAKLLIVMIIFNALAALAVVPAWISMFRPKFVTRPEKNGGGTKVPEGAVAQA